MNDTNGHVSTRQQSDRPLQKRGTTSHPLSEGSARDHASSAHPFTPQQVADAYEHCRQVTAAHARTFYFASYFLKQKKRAACYAVYAFCRYVDNLADEHFDSSDPVTTAATERVIGEWRNDMRRVYEGESIDDPVMIAWADLLQRYGIPQNLPELLIEGCISDLRPSIRYETFDELYEYCYRVASVVGLMTSRIFGYTNPSAEARAVDLGIAMQLTNILRDVGEDAEMDRLYLPREELHQFGIDETRILRGDFPENFPDFMKFQIERARRYYASANVGISMLEKDSRLTVRLMSHNYAGILDSIERNNYDVFSHRAFVPMRKKLMSVPELWYQTMMT